MSKYRPRRNEPKAWLGVFGISALITVMVVGASPATADVDSLTGEAYAISLNSSLLGEVIPPTPGGVMGSATEPVDGFNESANSVGPVNVLNLVGAGVLNASTVGSGLIGENHFAQVDSFASAADVQVGLGVGGINLGVVEADCFAGGPGSGGSVRLVDAAVGSTPLVVGAGTTQLNIPGILNIIINERTKTEMPGSFTEITINAIHIELLASLDTPLGDIVNDVPLLGDLLGDLLGTGDGGGGGGDPLGGLLGELPLVGDLIDGLLGSDTVADLLGPGGIDLGDLLLPGLFNGDPLVDLIVAHVNCRAEGPNVLIPPTTAPPTTAPPTTAPPTTAPPTTGPPTTAPPTTAPPTTAVPTTAAPTTAPPTTAAPTTVAGATTTTPKVLAITGNETRPLTVFAVVSSVLGILLWFGGAPDQGGPGGPRRRRRFSF